MQNREPPPNRPSHSPLRVLHCPTNTGAHPAGVAWGERLAGLDSHCVTLREDPFGFRADEVLAPEGTSPVRFEARRWRLLLRALRDFDVIHFNFGRSILPSIASLATLEAAGLPRPVIATYGLYARLLEHRDLALLHRAGKRIAVTFQGDDVRQGDVCRAAYEIEPSLEAGYYTPQADAEARRRVARFARYADLIYALNPDLLRVLPERARFQSYGHLDLADWKPVEPVTGRPPLVIHAPTHRGVKGTRFLLQAVERLRQAGLRFDFELVEGLRREEARKVYERADLLVDQLLVGWYGGLAVELMALGKPVMAFIREADLGGIPRAMADEIPVISATPGELEDVLARWIRAPRDERLALGERSRRYVERWHDPRAIGQRQREDYESLFSAAPA